MCTFLCWLSRISQTKLLPQQKGYQHPEWTEDPKPHGLADTAMAAPIYAGRQGRALSWQPHSEGPGWRPAPCSTAALSQAAPSVHANLQTLCFLIFPSTPAVPEMTSAETWEISHYWFLRSNFHFWNETNPKHSVAWTCSNVSHQHRQMCSHSSPLSSCLISLSASLHDQHFDISTLAWKCCYSDL